MKVFCIGRNYAAHIEELNNEVPSEPVVFIKPATAVLSDNKPFYYPNFSNDIHYEGELVCRISKNGRAVAPQFALDYIDAVTVGIDFTARDLQEKQKQKGLPWEIAKAFDHSAVIGTWVPVERDQLNNPFQFELHKNGAAVQHGDTSLWLHNLPKMISYISTYFTLQQGDVLFTGTPKGVGPIQINDEFSGHLAGKMLFETRIR